MRKLALALAVLSVIVASASYYSRRIAESPAASIDSGPIAAIVVTNASNNLVATYIIGNGFVERFDQRDTVIKRPGKPDQHLGPLPASAALAAAGKAQDVEVISVQSTSNAHGVPHTGAETII